MPGIPNGRGRRAKGGTGEREVVALLHRYGWRRARRNFASGGQGGSDIVDGPADTAWEVKRVESLNIHKAYAQAQDAAAPYEMPVVAFRRNGGKWLAIIELEELLPLLRLKEHG